MSHLLTCSQPTWPPAHRPPAHLPTCSPATGHLARGAGAAVVCYSVTDGGSWERVHYWVEELRKVEERCRIYVAATKVDLVAGRAGRAGRAVDYHDTADYCRDIGAQLFEVRYGVEPWVRALGPGSWVRALGPGSKPLARSGLYMASPSMDSRIA